MKAELVNMLQYICNWCKKKKKLEGRKNKNRNGERERDVEMRNCQLGHAVQLYIRHRSCKWTKRIIHNFSVYQTAHLHLGNLYTIGIVEFSNMKTKKCFCSLVNFKREEKVKPVRERRFVAART